jgi:hypothetical protein
MRSRRAAIGGGVTLEGDQVVVEGGEGGAGLVIVAGGGEEDADVAANLEGSVVGGTGDLGPVVEEGTELMECFSILAKFGSAGRRVEPAGQHIVIGGPIPLGELSFGGLELGEGAPVGAGQEQDVGQAKTEVGR